jgi:hypothetical protein
MLYSLPQTQRSASALLQLWETARCQTPIGRALTLVATMLPERSAADLMQLSLGQRNLWLIKLREQLFGHSLISVTTCLHCQESVEVQFDTPMLYRDSYFDEAVATEITFHFSNYSGILRRITSADLAAIALLNDITLATQELVQRCLLTLQHDNNPIATEQLSDEVITALEKALLEADPLAEIRLELNCPSCNQQWKIGLDIAEFLWEELSQLAQNILAQVHQLALAYGWSETTILALSETRRHYYLKRVSG